MPGPGAYCIDFTPSKYAGASMGHRTASGSFMNKNFKVPGVGAYNLASTKKTKGGTMGCRSKSTTNKAFKVGPG